MWDKKRFRASSQNDDYLRVWSIFRGGMARSPSVKPSGLNRKLNWSCSTDVIRLLKLQRSSVWTGTGSSSVFRCNIERKE